MAQLYLLLEGTRDSVNIDFDGIKSAWIIQMRLRDDYSVLADVTNCHPLQSAIVKRFKYDVVIKLVLPLNCSIDILH